MNIKIFKRKKDGNQRLSNNFKAKEFFCKCGNCEDQLIDLDHVKKLQQLRDDLGISLTITSGYRCPTYNTEVGGTDNSQHKLGTATDIQSRKMPPSEIQDASESFMGLGRYDTFTHIDSRSWKARWDKRKKKDLLPSGPSDDDINVDLDAIENEILNS